MIPDRERANKELKWAADLNPGPWKEHSLYVAAACESIASRCSHMDRDRAYVLGLLHDTGRYAGRTSERHLLDGYRRCMEHGWEEAARICMSHAFMIQDIGTSIGEFDVTPQDYEFMKALRQPGPAHGILSSGNQVRGRDHPVRGSSQHHSPVEKGAGNKGLF